MKDGVSKADRRDKKRKKKMPIHGRSLEAVMNAIRNRVKRV